MLLALTSSTRSMCDTANRVWSTHPPAPPALPIAFFDGVCKLCNGYVDFMLKHDRRGRLRFASLQGQLAQSLIEPVLPVSGNFPSIVLLDEQGVHQKSAAVLRMLVRLGGPWRLLRPLTLL